jgi:ABC-2 type transport system ATP-binding protein
MIKITNITKSFDGQKVLENLNCNIKTGSIYGLVGANGAGKSTLLRIITDIYKQDSGTIEVDGSFTGENEEIKQKMVFVPDDLFFFPNYNLIDMANFYQSMYKNFDMQNVLKLAGTLNLNTKAKINSFSKGMKRQCALICAISTNADYMFFDETFDGLDPVIRNFFRKAIREQLEKKPTTIIMTSHNLKELEDICDNLGLLYKGGIFFESDIDSIKTNMFKVQISLNRDFDKNTFDSLEVMNFKKSGSIATIILKGNREKTEEFLRGLNPVVLDFLPLSLEEVFIYEMEVLGYEFNNILQ